ncbi:hypothetical protein [Streptomyces sp. CFMR 7]|uniref:hypothetical protein n=1 Tax=Streptomyces sp. CFMR 7 TaxID=1649184 RepID=UPI00119FF4B7|nr:hypothetical protein [Streptomyces sp. CFMR 7]
MSVERELSRLVADNGKQFLTETIDPWELAPGDRIFYHDAREGYVTILARGADYYKERACHRPGDPLVRVTPVLAYWANWGWPSMWDMSNAEVFRILRELGDSE